MRQQFEDFILRALVLVLALALPLLAASIFVGAPPPSLNVHDLDQWSPVRSPGPSTEVLAQGLTYLAGVGEGEYPEWFTEEDQALLAQAKTALDNNKLQQAMGHLMVLSGNLEERGKTLNDFIPIVAPDLSSWIVANYFAPIILGTLFVCLTLLIFGPWLIKRFYDFLKLLITLLISLVAIAFAASLCFAIASEKALVFALIEYLTLVALLLCIGNLIVHWIQKMRTKRQRLARERAIIAAARTQDRLYQRPSPSLQLRAGQTKGGGGGAAAIASGSTAATDVSADEKPSTPVGDVALHARPLDYEPDRTPEQDRTGQDTQDGNRSVAERPRSAGQQRRFTEWRDRFLRQHKGKRRGSTADAGA